MIGDKVRWLQRLLSPLKRTPLHPQWLSFRNSLLEGWISGIEPKSRVLDVGCYDRWPERFIDPSASYVGVDYVSPEVPVYESSVDVFGDAHDLPFCERSFDYVLLLDVFEHLPDAERALSEISRVLVDRGRLVLQVPFMYPIHDAPNDYRRYTEHGLEKLFCDKGFVVSKRFARGSNHETSVLLSNIAMSKGVVDLATRSILFALMTLILVYPLIVLNNLTGWFSGRFMTGKTEKIMPFSYQYVLEKNTVTTVPETSEKNKCVV